MDISLWSLITFVIFTVLYFRFGKPVLTLEDLESDQTKIDYYKRNLKGLAFYFGLIVVLQCLLNTTYLMNKCGGALDKNIGAAVMFTFIPWMLIFGVMIAVLIMFPGFKSAFSDVIGYFAVAGSANDIFASILLGSDINDMIDQTDDPNKKKDLTKAAEALVKICGNKSILINQMNPDNFMDIWNILKELMVPGAYTDQAKKTELFNLVVLKDNIGEALWYIYTAILISSIVYYNLATRGCIKTVDQIQSEHDQFVKQKEEAEQKAASIGTEEYVISS
jgi:hypothetical protein